MPDRWLSRCRMVTSSATCGKSAPRIERAVVSSDSVPSTTRLIIASAVNPLVPLASARIESGLTGTCHRRSARPTARSTGSRPGRSIPMRPENEDSAATSSRAVGQSGFAVMAEA